MGAGTGRGVGAGATGRGVGRGTGWGVGRGWGAGAGFGWLPTPRTGAGRVAKAAQRSSVAGRIVRDSCGFRATLSGHFAVRTLSEWRASQLRLLCVRVQLRTSLGLRIAPPIGSLGDLALQSNSLSCPDLSGPAQSAEQKWHYDAA